MALPQGWKQKSGEALLYQASYPNYQKGESGTTSLNITTNKANGNYDVYQPGLFGDTLIYSYNASNGQKVVRNQNLYEQIFVGSGTKAAQLESLDRRVRSETYKIAVDQKIGGQNSTTSRELEVLKAKPGYKMFGDGTVQIAPPADPQGGNSDSQRQASKPLAFEDGLELGATLEALNEEETNTAPSLNGSGGSSGNAYGPAPTLRYPIGNLDSARELGITYDYIKITAVENIRTIASGRVSADASNAQLVSISNDLANANTSLTQKYIENQKALARIILPMQPNLSSANSTNWGTDSANILQILAGSYLNSYLSGIQGDTNFFQSAQQQLTNFLQNDAEKLINTAVGNQQQIAALLAGQIVNANIQQRATGTVINPNMELLFNGPRMRTFQFTFDMVPRFEEEAQSIRKIIKCFKMFMAPSKTLGNAFLRSPKVFLLDYIYNGDMSTSEFEQQYGENAKSHPYLNKIKPCALTDFSVNYTPSGSYMTYRQGGSMTAYQISMTFSELEPIYQNDYFGEGESTISVLNKNDMGF